VHRRTVPYQPTKPSTEGLRACGVILAVTHCFKNQTFYAPQLKYINYNIEGGDILLQKVNKSQKKFNLKFFWTSFK
jgi:hypothetical protein